MRKATLLFGCFCLFLTTFSFGATGLERRGSFAKIFTRFNEAIPPKMRPDVLPFFESPQLDPALLDAVGLGNANPSQEDYQARFDDLVARLQAADSSASLEPISLEAISRQSDGGSMLLDTTNRMGAVATRLERSLTAEQLGEVKAAYNDARQTIFDARIINRFVHT